MPETESPPEKTNISDIDAIMPKPKNKGGRPRKNATEVPDDAPKATTCGLPKELVRSKPALVGYAKQYGTTQQEWSEIEITPKERAMYELYQRAAGVIHADRRFFVAAARLWAKGFPIEMAKRDHLNTMKIEG